MVVDSSIFVAIAHKEKDYEKYIHIIIEADTVVVSAGTMLETYIVLSQQSSQAWKETENLIEAAGIDVMPFDSDTLKSAMSAYHHYGKGRGHKAQLNYGDCFSYATAKALNEPLLFIGNDFNHTDLQSAL